MILNNITPKHSAIFLGILCAIDVTYYLIKKYKSAQKPNQQVLFFSATQNNNFREHERNSECAVIKCYCHNFHKLMRTLIKVDKQLDICMYLITTIDIARVIITAHVRGVKVRIITDYEMAHSTGSKIDMLKQVGVPVRYRKSMYLMHHKFCVIDDMLMIGSLNLTMNAIAGNWENVIMTTKESLVKQYKMEYERIWSDFSN